MEFETWAKETTILESETFVENSFFILSGRVKMSASHPETGREQTLFLFDKGDLFDAVALLDSCPTHGMICSLDDIQLLRISSNALLSHILSNQQLTKNFFRYLGKLLRHLEGLSTDLSIHDVPTRLVKLILQHAGQPPHNGPLGLIHDFTHEELAKLVGSTRVVVSRILQSLKNEGSILLHRKHLETKDIEKMLEKHEKEIQS